MKKAVNNSKRLVIFSFILSAVFLQTSFQNCSPRSANFAVTGEIGQDQSYTAEVTRSLNVSPITDKIENIQPIKVLIVVDDSQTMQNSQTNLAQSMGKLASLISNYDAEIMVISTTCSNCIVSTNKTPVVTETTRTNVTEKKLNPALKVYKFLKSQTESQKAAVVTALSNAIKAVGTAGSQFEKPLYSMAIALDSDTFLKANDNVLVYVITDENDTASNPLSISAYLKLQTTVTQLAIPMDSPIGSTPGCAYNLRYYRGTWNEVTPGGGGGTCGTDDLGNPIPCNDGGDSVSSASKEPFFTYQECWNDIGSNQAANCSQVDQPRKEPLGGRTVAEVCAQLRLNYPNQVTSCVATTIQTGGPYTIPEKQLSQEKLYFAEANLASGNLQAKIIELLNKKFGGNYLIAAQVNKEGQNCTLGQGQSYDLAFKKFETLAPKGRFIRSSICEEAAVSGDVLREIALQLTINITNQYSVVLDESERILNITAVKNTERVPLTEGLDFTFAENIVRLVSLSPADFDYLEVGVGKKENWNQ